MKVLVSGASGFLGRFVVESFLARGHQVRALVRPSTKVEDLWSGTVDVVRADLASPNDRLEGVFDAVDAVVHLAALVSGEESEQFATTAVGTERLLSAMCRSSCRRVVLASSFTVYDWAAAPGELTEETPLATDLEARGGYTRAKVWQERVARRMADEHHLQLTVVRPGIIWGPGNPYPAGVSVPLGTIHLVFGVGTTLPFTFVENCADCFVAVTESPTAVGQTFNTVDPPVVSTRRFVREHLRHTGARGFVLPVPYGLGLALVRLVDAANHLLFEGRGRVPSVLVPARFIARFRPMRFGTAKLEAVTGWRPPYDLGAALQRTYGSAARPSP